MVETVKQATFNKYMINNNLRRLLPRWPVVPTRLWLTVALGLLAVANLMFRAEVWPHTPGAEPVAWTSLLLTATACLFQVAAVLNQWMKSYAGPRWAQMGLRLCIMPLWAGCLVAAVMLAIMVVFLGSELARRL